MTLFCRLKSNIEFKLNPTDSNPADVVYTAFSQAFLQGIIRMFENDREMQSIVMKDVAAREQATKHFFKRAQRQAMDG